MSSHLGAFRIGTSGYHYDHWRGVFYPEELSTAEWFSHYARQFDTVEINNTFYRLPEATTFEAWRRQAPKGFCYALKFSRYGSHIVRLKKPRDTIGKFLKRADRLGEFLGPILVQLPPNWKADPERLNAFLKAAPDNHRWAIEFRDPRWLCEEVFAILKKRGCALCIHDMIDNHPRLVTAGWVYLRFHGEHYSGSYSSEKLRAEARWIKQQLTGGKDVFAYFNNDAQGYAVANAIELRRHLQIALPKFQQTNE
jgi:uncharacterized protein YecE (DUF72 family)